MTRFILWRAPANPGCAAALLRTLCGTVSALAGRGTGPARGPRPAVAPAPPNRPTPARRSRCCGGTGSGPSARNGPALIARAHGLGVAHVLCGVVQADHGDRNLGEILGVELTTKLVRGGEGGQAVVGAVRVGFACLRVDDEHNIAIAGIQAGESLDQWCWPRGQRVHQMITSMPICRGDGPRRYPVCPLWG